MSVLRSVAIALESPAAVSRRVAHIEPPDGTAVGLLFSALGFLAGSVFLVAVNWPAAIPVVVAVGAAGVVATNRMISGAGSADEEFDPIEVVLAEAREYPPSESRGVAEARAIFRRLLPVTRAAVAGARRGERRA